jgi:hypothetical protein
MLYAISLSKTVSLYFYDDENESFLDCVFFIPSLSRLCDKDRHKNH